MNLLWENRAWNEYVAWQACDMRVIRRINTLIEDVLRHPEEGLGKPEHLKHQLAGCWSRRITDEHRLVYLHENGAVKIISCRHHYVA